MDKRHRNLKVAATTSTLAVMAALFWFSPAYAGSTDDFRGWSWNEHVGWMSWNCVNTDSCTIDYGVKFSGDDILGWIWSDQVGWICVGATCADPTLPAPSGATRAWLDGGTALGWSRIISLGADGWISLQSVTANRATGEVRGWMWNQNDNGTGIGWISLNCADQGVCGASNYFVTISTTETICNNALDDDIDGVIDCADRPDCNGKPGGVAGQLCGVESSASANCQDNFDNDADGLADCRELDCFGIDPACPTVETGFCTNGRDDDVDGAADCTDADCASDPVCQTPETNCIDGIDNNFNGLIDCRDPDCAAACAIGKCDPGGDACLRDAECGGGGACVVEPFSFFESSSGALYTRGSFEADRFPPEEKYNASSCLLSAAAVITYFNADPTGQCTQPPVVAARVFPASGNQYASALGALDVSGILAGAYGAVKDGGPIPAALAGSVYHLSSDLTINDSITFTDATGNDSGAGTVVVDGDLIVNADLSYGTGSLSKLKNLASVGWIVLGNVTINPSVKEIVGNFYVQGSFDTGAGSGPLTVRGSVIANDLALGRTYADLSRGSELVIDDGRLVANPPPGFIHSGKSLPIWEAVASP